MTTFKEFNEYLVSDANGNTWYQSMIDIAGELVDELDEQDWKHLLVVWKNQSINGQIRLAETLSKANQPRIFELLVQMLQSPEFPVALAAADSLEAKDDIWSPHPSLRHILENLRNRTEGGDRQAIERLLARIQS